MKTRLALTAAGLLALGAAPAGAATYCVSDPACPAGGIQAATPQAALTQANAASDADTVRLGPGVFAGPLTAGPGTTIAGATADSGTTTIIGPATGALLDVNGATATARRLTLRMSDDATTAVSGSSSVVEFIVVDGSALTADDGIGVTGRGVTFRDGRIVMARGVGAQGGLLTLEDVSIDAPLGYANGDYPATLRRVLIKANKGIVVNRGTVTADTVAVITSGSVPIAVQASPDAVPFAATANLTHATLIGPASGTGVYVGGACVSNATVRLIDSAIGGFATQIARLGGSGQTDCTRPASVELTRTAYDAGKVISTGAGTLTTNAVVQTSALGLGPDYVPTEGSPLLNAGNPAEAPGVDLRRLPRPFASVPDLGAYEYQGPPHPQPTVTSAPTSAPTAQPTVTPTPTATLGPPALVPLLTVSAVRKSNRRYRVRAIVDAGGTSCAGAEARFHLAGSSGSESKRFGAGCRAGLTLRARPGTKLRVRFTGTGVASSVTTRIRLPE